MKYLVAIVVFVVGCGNVSARMSLLPEGDGATALEDVAKPPVDVGGEVGSQAEVGDAAQGADAGAADAGHDVDAVEANANAGDGVAEAAEGRIPPVSIAGHWTIVWGAGLCVGTMDLLAGGGDGTWDLSGPFLCSSEAEGYVRGTATGTQSGDEVALKIHTAAITAHRMDGNLDGVAVVANETFVFTAHR